MTGGTGVYGGTFNPIHLGHLRAAEEVAEALDLDEMLFVPSAQPPHKPTDRIAPAADRLAWARLAVSGQPRFRVDPLEIEREGPSYTVDTLGHLADRLGSPPVFTIGRDAFVEMGSWRQPDAIFTLAHIAVTTRPPIDESTLRDWMPTCAREAFELAGDGRSGRHRERATWIRLVEVTALDISASDIRQRIADGRSTRYLMPEPVRLAVESSGVYADSQKDRRVENTA